VIGQSRIDVLRRAVKEITLDGLILEFGVYTGGTAKILSKLLPDKVLRVYLKIGMVSILKVLLI